MRAESLTGISDRVRGLRFAVVGAYVADCFVATSRLPAWGLEYEADSVRISPGGKALNQAIALARLGAHVTAVGAVGGDALGQEVLSTLTREGVEVGGMQIREKAPTSVCVCFVGRNGETSFVWHIADDVAVTPHTVRAAEAAIQGADGVLVTFELPLSAIREATGVARERGTRVIVQPAPALAGPDGYALIPWDQVDVLVPNETEARAVLEGVGSGEGRKTDDLASALAAELGVATVVVTLGESGCVAHAAGTSGRYPAHRVVPVDTTGASDAFVAFLAACMLAGGSEAEAIKGALAAAAWAVGQPGGHAAMPSWAEVAGMLSCQP